MIPAPTSIREFFTMEFDFYLDDMVKAGGYSEARAKTFWADERETLAHLLEAPWPDVSCWIWADIYTKDGSRSPDTKSP